MFDGILKNKKIIFGVLAVIVLFLGYRFFFVKETEDAGPSVLIEDKTSVSENERTILQLLADMQSLRLDASILKNKNFLSLEDFSVPLQPEPQGRPNPFAPVGGTVSILPAAAGNIEASLPQSPPSNQ